MSKKVLIVEDTDADWVDYLHTVSNLLGVLGKNTLHADTQHKAISLVRENNFQIAFIDITLPIDAPQGNPVVDAGLKIMSEIIQANHASGSSTAIFIFSNNINNPAVDSYKDLQEQYPEALICQLPKADLQERGAEETIQRKILTNVEKCSIANLKKERNINRLLAVHGALNSGTALPDHAGTYIYDELNFSGANYFSRKAINGHLESLLSYPKKGKWGDVKGWRSHSIMYFHLHKLDAERDGEFFGKLNKKALKVIKNIIAYLAEVSEKTPEQKKLKYHQIGVLDIANVTEPTHVNWKFVENLLLRQVVVALLKIADETNRSDLRLTANVLVLFDYEISTEYHTKQFASCLGFKTKSGTIDISNPFDVFQHEQDFVVRSMSVIKEYMYYDRLPKR